MTAQPDVFVIQKKTALERYTRRPLDVDFFDYLEKDGQSLDALIQAHNEHVQSRDTLLSTLGGLGLSSVVHTLDDLTESHLGFYAEADHASGLHPRSGVVLALGGDGTLLHASHYVGGDTLLAGVNSSPTHSVGHLCAILPDEIPRKVACLFAEGLAQASAGATQEGLTTTRVRRLRMSTSRAQSLPLALNDILVTNRHPAATSRYQMTIARDGTVESTEKQLSSGIWISAPAGSTAAIASYGLERLPLEDARFLYAVREPYMPPDHSLTLLKGRLEGGTHVLKLFCRMRQGLVCVDGPDSSAYLGFGESVDVSLPPSAALRLLTNFSHKPSTG